MVKFVIISTQRSGSALLVTSLTSHPQIQCYREIFLPSNPDPETYRTYRTMSFKRQVIHWLQRKKLIESYLNELQASHLDTKALGFKFMYSQARQFPQVVGWIKENDVKVIHLIRKNILKRVISGETAKLRKVYHSTKPLAPVQVSLQPDKLKRTMTHLVKETAKYRQVFSGGPYLEITYESFVTNRDSETQRLLQFLEVDPRVTLTTDLVKINPNSLKELIVNYDEVAQALQGTEFECFLY